MATMRDAHEIIFNCAEWLTVGDVAKRLGGRSSDVSFDLYRWAADRRIFAINHHGIDYFPAFGLHEAARAGILALEPKPILAVLIDALGGECSGWQLAGWFISVNGYLDGKRPVDLMDGEPECLLEAAKFYALGIQHG
jgi:hypothetical protein